MGEEGREAPFFLSFEKEVFSFPLSLIPPTNAAVSTSPNLLFLHFPKAESIRERSPKENRGDGNGELGRRFVSPHCVEKQSLLFFWLSSFFSFNEGQYGEGGHPFLLLPDGLGTSGALLHAPKHSTDRKEERERCFLSFPRCLLNGMWTTQRFP